MTPPMTATDDEDEPVPDRTTASMCCFVATTVQYKAPDVPSAAAPHACTLQGSLLGPKQSRPPLRGRGSVHERVRVPPPQSALHVDQALHPPSTATNNNMNERQNTTRTRTSHLLHHRVRYCKSECSVQSSRGLRCLGEVRCRNGYGGLRRSRPSTWTTHSNLRQQLQSAKQAKEISSNTTHETSNERTTQQTTEDNAYLHRHTAQCCTFHCWARYTPGHRCLG